MTITTAIESAFYDLIIKQELGSTPPLIRCWHSLRYNQRWDWTKDRELPCIDIRCSPGVPTDGGATLTAQCSITIKTNGNDDKDHAQIGMIEDGVQTAVDTLYSEHRNGCTGANWIEFEKAVKDNFSLVDSLGGIEITQGEEPGNDGDDPTVGFRVTVHYSRADY